MKCFALLCCAVLLFIMPLSAQDEETLKKKQAEIAAFLKTAKTERDLRAAVMDLSKLADEAMEIRKYDLSAKLYSDAERACKAIPDPAQAQEYQEAAKRMTEIGKEFQKASKSVERIITKQATPEDYLASGKFLCFVLGEWAIGIEDLSKGKDAGLKKLAEDDLAGADPISIGDSWAARKEPGAKTRAAYWYAKVFEKATGIEREKLRGKLRSVFFRPGKTLGIPAGWAAAKGNIAIDEACSRSGSKSLLILPTGVHHYPKVRQPVTAGKKYTISAWVMTDGSDKDFSIFMLNYKEGKVETTGALTASADRPWWVRVEKTITIPAGAEVSLACTGWYGSGKAWIDDLSIKAEDGTEYVVDGGFER